jgi:hypothetical protein
MSAVELKQRIISRVNSIEDVSILEELYQLLQTDGSEFYEMTEPELKAVEEGLEDIKQGRVYSSEQAHQLIQEWLKK